MAPGAEVAFQAGFRLRVSFFFQLSERALGEALLAASAGGIGSGEGGLAVLFSMTQERTERAGRGLIDCAENLSLLAVRFGKQEIGAEQLRHSSGKKSGELIIAEQLG